MDPTSFSFAGFPWLAFALAIVANVVIGFLWYATWSPTGKVWMREVKMDPNHRPSSAEMGKAMGLMILGALLLMFVFTHTMWAYEDAMTNPLAKGDPTYNVGVADGVMAGVMTTLGFVVPLHLNRVAFEKGTWSLFFVNTGYFLVSLIVAGILIATVG